MPLIRLFLDIALFKKGPQAAPGSVFLLGLALAANLGASLALALLEADWLESLLQSLTGGALLAGFLWGALSLTRKQSRWLQTATAAFGCDTLVSALAFPLLLGSQFTPDAAEALGLLLQILLLWQIAVIGHILRHALNVPFLAGFGLAFAYTVASIGIIMVLFPAVS